MTGPTELSRSSFAIVANGFADGPAQAVRDYLVAHDASVFTVFHPLTPEQGGKHVADDYERGEHVRTRAIPLPLRAPLSFGLDPFVPLRLPTVDLWLGFNPLACARGLARRRRGRATRVVLWSVDFVPGRFGRTPLTRVYNRLDRLCCVSADARVELSAEARDARNRLHGLDDGGAPTHVVPMGAWLGRVQRTPEDGYARRRVVFLGHLVPRQGVGMLLDALGELTRRDVSIEADIVGDGPLLSDLQIQAAGLGIDGRVRFHGFVEDHRAVEELLAAGSLAVAPYAPSADSFTRYADPGKLKAYLAAGLPTVLTAVPPLAAELADRAGAEIVAYEARALANAIESGLGSPETWRERHRAALAYAAQFDWEVLLADFFGGLGFA